MVFSRFRHILLILATIGSILLAFLLLSSLLLVWVNPSLLGHYVYLGFGFSALFVANIISFIYWALRRKVQLLIPLAAITLTWSLWSHTFQSGWMGHSVTEAPNAFKVLSYNVRMFDFYNWSKEKGTGKKILTFINNSGADVVCMQEFYTNNDKRGFTQKMVDSQLSRFPFKAVSFSPSVGYGTAIYSRYPIVNNVIVDFGDSGNSALFVDVNVKGMMVRVINVHLESLRLDKSHLEFVNQMEYPSDKGETKKLNEIDERYTNALVSRVKQANSISTIVKKSPYKTIVAGDFNDVPVSYVYHKIKGDLNDSFVSEGSGFGGTYFGFKVPFRIDYIFYSDSVECLAYKRFNSTLSDHRPIMGSYQLQ